jgi:Glyoxalase/Bleomycin resistance protein/Dioxygenase superfamily
VTPVGVQAQVSAVLAGVVDYRFHHLGVAVTGEVAARRVTRALGVTPAWRNVLERHECVCEYCPGPLLDVELVVPLSSTSSTRKIPPGLHHVGLKVSDIAEAQRQLSARGYNMVEPEPLTIVDRYLVNFLEPLRVGFLIELVEDMKGISA